MTYQAGAEFLVNTRTYGGQNEPKVTGLANGGFVITWEDGNQELGDTSPPGIAAQVFDAHGNKVGSDFQVSSDINSFQYMPRIGSLTDGGFVIAWHGGSGVLDPDVGVTAQIFDASGNKIGTEFLVSTSVNEAQLVASVTGLANGNFVITWMDTSDISSDGSGASIKAQLFTAAGGKIGTEFLVNTEVSGNQRSATVTSLESGGFVVTWNDDGGTLGDSDLSVKAQVFDATGNKVGAEVLVNTQTADEQREPTVTGLADGGFVITWWDFSGTLGDADATSVKAQIFNVSGTKVGTEFLVNTFTASYQTKPTIAALPDGGFIIAWSDNSQAFSDKDTSSIAAQVFDATGNKVGAQFQVNTETANGQSQPSVAVLADGSFVISWWDSSQTLGDDSAYSSKAKVFTLLPSATEGDDNLTGTTGNDTIDGLGGNDTISGLDGHDALTGGAGIDSISGGAGNDSLSETSAFQAGETYDGGDGIDTLSGYGDLSSAAVTGIEQLNVTAGRDVKITAAQVSALTTITAGAGSSFTIADAGSVVFSTKMAGPALIYTSAAGNALFATEANDTIYGGAGDDYLFAKGGNDILRSGNGDDGLDGGEGADSLYGGFGDDFYTVDNVGDKVIELAGQGIDTIYALITYKASDNVENVYLGAGDIAAYGNALNNLLRGSSGNNTLNGADGDDEIYGMEGNDKIDGGAGHDYIQGNDGKDSLTGGDGSDSLDGGDGDDQMNGGARWDTLEGGYGNDILDGGADNDVMYGGFGNDTYVVDHIGDRVTEYEDEGTDTVKASISYALTANVEILYLTGMANITGTGNGLSNAINGNSGNNTLTGGLGNDSLYGREGNDSLVGGDDHDRLSGGNGDDTLVGGRGNDVLGGGTGADAFVFSSFGTNGHDHIVDFEHGVDRLVFNGGNYIFGAGHVLTAAEFTVGASAVGSSAQFIWDAVGRHLYFDTDGTGAGEAIELAMISTGTVSKEDLVFI